MSENCKSTIIAEGSHTRLARRGTWEYIERIGAQGVVAIVAEVDDKIILIEQFRPPVNCAVIELPAGLAGDIPGQQDESMVIAAHRELVEETGYEADEMFYLTEGPPSPGLSSETIVFFRALGLQKIAEGGGVESEDIIVHEAPLKNIDIWLQRKQDEGCAIDPKVYTGLYFLEGA